MPIAATPLITVTCKNKLDLWTAFNYDSKI